MFNNVRVQSRNGTSLESHERRQHAYDFLSTHPVGVLATTDPDCEPHAAVIYFSVDEHMTVSFLTRSGTKKYDNLMHFDHAILTVYDPKTQSVGQVIGRAVEVTDPDAVNEIAAENMKACLQTSDGGLPPITKLYEGDVVAFRLFPVEVRLAIYSRPDPGDYSKMFETMDSYELKADDLTLDG